MSRHPLLIASFVLTLLTIFLTWPQTLYLSSRFASHVDPFFSVWRLAWIAHALAVDPAHLFDGNIFHPATRTLAFSDATMLEGILAAPFLWAGVNRIWIYNVLLLTGFLGSGIGMFVLARSLTGSAPAGLVAAAIFTMVPYRIEHFMHLELQWAMWIPFAFWAVHRVIERPSWRRGALVGVFLWLQTLSCVYYGVFLAIGVVVLASGLIVRTPDRAPAAVGWLAFGGAVALLLTWPYARPYIDNARLFGGRDVQEILRYSATPISYLSAPSQNWVWGWTGDRFGAPELRLFPGIVAVSLAGVAVMRSPKILTWVYVLIVFVAVEISFGLHGWLYSWMHARIPGLSGLRALARCAIVAYCALAVLAAIGFAFVEQRLHSRRRMGALIAVVMLLALEYASAPMVLTAVDPKVTSVYKTIRGLGPGIILELPLPALNRLPGDEAMYEFWSINHWNRLVNGYSGYYPPEYIRTVVRMRTFPDAMALSRLEALGVRYIVVHRAFFKRDEYGALLTKMVARPELKVQGAFEDALDEATLFELVR